MLRFIGFRLLQFPLILAVIYLATFTLAWIAPGSPFERTDRKVDKNQLQRLKERFHAEHWYTFLGSYPWRIITHGDFGPSLAMPEFSVNDIMKESLPVSATIGLAGLELAVLAGVGIGTLAAVKRGGAFDWFSLSLALVGISLPSFVAAALLLMVFSVQVKWFPIGGWGSPVQVILPAIALSLAPMAYIARLTRVSMIDVLSSDYVRTARAKGLSRWSVIWKHCLKNAFLPVLSYLGPAAAATLTGSFVIEKVFNIRGLGSEFVNSVLNRDQTLILGTVMVYSALLMTLNLAVDVGYAMVDPRIDVTVKRKT